MISLRLFGSVFMCLLMLTSPGFAQGGLNGSWKVVPQMSHEIGGFRTMSAEIRLDAKTVTVVQRWGTRNIHVDSITVPLNGTQKSFPVRSRVWPANVFMGVSMPVGGSRRVSATIDKAGSLTLEEQYDIRGSQGSFPIAIRHSYALSDDPQVLHYTMTRPTRRSRHRWQRPIVFTSRSRGRHARNTAGQTSSQNASSISGNPQAQREPFGLSLFVSCGHFAEMRVTRARRRPF